MGELSLKARTLDLFVVESKGGSVPYGDMVVEKAERPAKLTPKKAPKVAKDPTVPLRKSPRTAVVQQKLKTKDTFQKPNTTKRPNSEDVYTETRIDGFPNVIFLGTQCSTNDEATSTLQTVKKNYQTSMKKPSQKSITEHSNTNTTTEHSNPNTTD